MGRARHQADYGELFQLHLGEDIERGGYVHHVVSLVEMFQRKDEETRCEEFEKGIRSTGAFTCTRCGDVFAPPEKVAGEAEVLCFQCRMR